jgi:hypothetical protein
MKTKLIFIALLTLIFSLFAHAEGAPVIKKIIPITSSAGMSVLQVYHENKNYKTVYKTNKSFMDEFCINNPDFFKKTGCTEKAFRSLPVKITWIFPSLPESKKDKTVVWSYDHNKILRSVFVKEACKQDTTKQCTQKAIQQIKIAKNLNIIVLPETYIISNSVAKTVVIGKNIYTKSEKNKYYRLVQNRRETKIITTPIVDEKTQHKKDLKPVPQMDT